MYRGDALEPTVASIIKIEVVKYILCPQYML